MPTTTDSLAPSTPDVVERMGLLWELDGLPRIAGRIIGHLLLQPDPQSLQAIADALGVSKASVSMDARRLERLGLVERIGRPGDRRDYYAIADDMLARGLAMRLESVRRLHEALRAARAIPDNAPAVRRRLDLFERVHAHAVRAIEELLEQLRPGAAADLTLTTGRP